MVEASRKVEPVVEKPQLVNELFQLRDILFGEDKRNFQFNLDELQESTQVQFDSLSTQLYAELSDLKSHIDECFSRLSSQISDVDHQHNETENEIKRCVDLTTNELSAFEEKSKQISSDIIDRVNGEADQLNDKFTRQYTDTLSQLDSVAAELNNSKADRKTLAQLLTTVAKSLDDDHVNG